jgi:hypothetical protein
MNSGDYHSDLLEMDETLDTDEEDESYDQEEVDDMLDALMEEEDEDYAERRRRRKQGRSRGRKQRKGVPTAKGRSTYREPVQTKDVSQRQLKDFADKAAEEDRRNAEGIKVVNDRLGKLDSRVDGMATVNELQTKRIRSLDTRLRLDGALDFASSFSTVPGDTEGSLNLVTDFGQIFRGAVKNGALGGGKGALSNPWVVGGIGLVLKNPTIISGLLGSGTK